jgi:hypothetical protein
LTKKVKALNLLNFWRIQSTLKEVSWKPILRYKSLVHDHKYRGAPKDELRGENINIVAHRKMGIVVGNKNTVRIGDKIYLQK